MSTYEMAFLSIASKNSFMTRDEAAACLNEFQAQPADGPPRSIEEIVKERGLLSSEQARILGQAARKVTAPAVSRPASSSTAIPAAPPAPPAPTVRATPPPPAPGKPSASEPIPGMRICGKLGVGGTATVFLAEDVKNNRKLALKIMHPSLAKDEKAMRRFQREAQLLIDFDHPNIVKGHAKGMMGPVAYFLMEHLEGQSVQEVLDKEKHLPEARSLEIIKETADAIDYMQSRGIVHRDIKPGNIFLLSDGRVKVLDLGFAQEMSGGGAEEETTSGTAQYMSPEQARGGRDLDVRADIYSLGATLYHMVMGELPFSGGDSLEVMAKQVLEALSSTGMKNRRVSKHMHYFIERMMSKDKDLRYATPKELVQDVDEQIDGFKSLEFNAEQAQTTSSAMKFMKGPPGGNEPPPPPSRLIRPPATRKIPRPLPPGPRFRKK